MTALVQTRSLTKRYTEVTALDDCTLDIAEGEVFGLLGPNGAGKTTLLRLIMGFLRPTEGQATVDGLDCYRDRVNVHQKIAYLPGDARLFRTMRGRQVLKFFSQVRKDTNLKRAHDIADRLELDLSRWVGFMSTGMRQKLALAVVLAVECPLLILDEPTANLDPSVRGEIMTMVVEARKAGRTVIFSSHVLSEVEDACDQVGILRAGKLVHTQSISDLKKQHRISARVKKDHKLPEVPEALRDQMTVDYLEERHVQIETPAELSTLFQWLANAPIEDVYVQPVGLRSVYDQFHHETAKKPELVEV